MEFTLDELRKIYDALTPELIRYLELTDGKMPKDGKRIALVVETRPNQYHVEPGTFDDKRYEDSKKGDK